ncbi:MAG: hypothetical protein AAF727_00415 [Pseudomonadota bacterium]
MPCDLTGLFRLHELAMKFGDGLKPDLLRVMTHPMDAYAHRVIPFHPPMASSGPAHQYVGDEALAQAGITRLSTAARRAGQNKDGTHG